MLADQQYDLALLKVEVADVCAGAGHFQLGRKPSINEITGLAFWEAMGGHRIDEDRLHSSMNVLLRPAQCSAGKPTDWHPCAIFATAPCITIPAGKKVHV